MHYDVIVIGMGLSGLMAAKTAAEAGAKVLIVGKGAGTLCLFSNSIDLLGDPGNGLSEWMKSHPQHPYSKLSEATTHEALASFISFFPAPYSFQSIGDRNCRILTAAGTLRPTRLVPATMIGATSIDSGALIVGFEGFKDFYASYAAQALKCRGITISLRETLNQEITATVLSRFFEMDSFRQVIAREIKKDVNHETRIGFPAVLGLHDPAGVKKEMENLLGVEVFEIPTLPPSIPGRRIFNRFKSWLIGKGVTFLLGQPVSKVLRQGEKCEGIYVHNPPVSTFYSGERFILAAGRFMGGGLSVGWERIIEPLFNFPVFQPRSREDWYGKSFADDHPLHQAGILTDPSLRPVNEEGSVLLENVWIAGSILAHQNLIEEKSREGIELATGHAAARNALKK